MQPVWSLGRDRRIPGGERLQRRPETRPAERRRRSTMLLTKRRCRCWRRRCARTRPARAAAHRPRSRRRDSAPARRAATSRRPTRRRCCSSAASSTRTIRWPTSSPPDRSCPGRSATARIDVHAWRADAVLASVVAAVAAEVAAHRFGERLARQLHLDRGDEVILGGEGRVDGGHVERERLRWWRRRIGGGVRRPVAGVIAAVARVRRVRACRRTSRRRPDRCWRRRRRRTAAPTPRLARRSVRRPRPISSCTPSRVRPLPERPPALSLAT